MKELKKKNYETGEATQETRGLRLCLGSDNVKKVYWCVEIMYKFVIQ